MKQRELECHKFCLNHGVKRRHQMRADKEWSGSKLALGTMVCIWFSVQTRTKYQDENDIAAYALRVM